jgi:hypothetical protein
MGFKDFYSNYKSRGESSKEASPEDKFFDAVGVRIPSLNAFTAWLILNDKIKPYILDVRTDRPKSLFGMPCNERILHFVNKLPQIKKLADEFSKKIQSK